MNMTRIHRYTSALILVLAFAFGAFAQTTFGVKTGVAIQKVYTTEGLGAVAPNFQNLTEFQFGVNADVPVYGALSFQPELLYTTKGFGLDQGLEQELFGTQIPLEAEAKSKFRYLEVPLLAKVSFGDPGGPQAYFVAGPTFGYALSGSLQTRARVLVSFDLPNVDINLDDINYERLEVGAAVGAGVQVPIGGMKFFADARYQRGFTELYDIPLVQEKVRNTGVAVSAGIAFPIGG
jgi:hypothetical protein